MLTSLPKTLQFQCFCLPTQPQLEALTSRLTGAEPLGEASELKRLLGDMMNKRGSQRKRKRKHVGHDIEDAHEAEMYPKRHHARKKNYSITRGDCCSEDNACYNREDGQ